jgi:hypothetical protein
LGCKISKVQIKETYKKKNPKTTKKKNLNPNERGSLQNKKKYLKEKLTKKEIQKQIQKLNLKNIPV